jgi:6-phospho-beta-glucosidase
MGVKVAVIGGGSTYTPELIEGLAQRAERLPIDELVLHDIAAERLEVVGGMAGRMLRRLAWPGRLRLTSSTPDAIDGAAFVLLQLRVGGQAARLVDETLPPRFGTIGQETTGAGGFAKALRTVPVVLDIAEQVAQRSLPSAWIVDFTNPVGIISQALLDAGHRAIGLCNVAIGFQRRFARMFGVHPDHVQLDHVGLNHLSWIRAVRVNGEDRLDEILDRDGEQLGEDVGLPLETLRRVHAVPSYYLRYYYRFAETLAEQRSKPTRAEEVMDIEAQLMDLYRDPKLDTKPALLENRGGAYYSLAAAQLLASLHDGAGDLQVVDVRNDGALPGLPDDAVVEITARIDRDGAHPVPVAPLDGEMLDLVRGAKTYERLAITAALSGDRGDALRALAANQLVGPYVDPQPLLDALLEANRALLPRFFPAAERARSG